MTVHAEEGKARKPPFAQPPLEMLLALGVEAGGTRGAILAVAYSARYGADKAEAFAIDRRAISDATGANDQAVRTAICRLVREGVLTRADGGFRLNTQPSTWPNVGPDRAGAIRRMTRPRALRHGNKPLHRGNKTADDALPPGNSPLPPGNTALPPGNNLLPPCNVLLPPGNAPLKREERETPEYLSQSAGEDGTTARYFPDSPPEAPLQPTGPKYHPAATPEVRAELVAMADTVNGWGPECSRELGMGADPEHVREALKRAGRTQPVPRTWRWVGAVLDGFKAHGIPAPPPPPPPGGGGRRGPMTDAEIEAKSALIMANLKAYEERERAERMAHRGAVA
jgi:hypothetical protein